VFYTVSRSNRVFSLENNPQQLRANVEEAKVTKTLATVMVGLACCWLPVCIIDYIDAALGEPTLARQAYLTYGFLVYPFIYGATHKRFRREYMAVLRDVLCLRRRRCTEITDVSSVDDSRRTRQKSQTTSLEYEKWNRCFLSSSLV